MTINAFSYIGALMFDNLGLTPQQQAVAEKIASYGFAAGFSEAGVAAMVTAALHESALNPTLSHPDAPPGSAQQFNSNGLFQMNRDRWADQVEFMQKNGLDVWSDDGQIQAFINEITNPPQPGISNYQKIAEALYGNDPVQASRAMSRIEGHATLRDAQGLTEADRRAQTASGIYKDDYGNLVGAKYEIQGPPVSAEMAKAPGVGLQTASMGGLLGPISAPQEDIPASSFFGQIGNAALQQTGQPFGALNMGTTAGFSRPGTSYAYVGTPVSPSLFNDELAPSVSAYAPPTAPDIPAPAPQTGAQLPEMASLPVGSFGAMPLGNYQMASVAQPAPPSPQPSANVSISALAGPAPSLSLSGRAVSPDPAPSAAIAPRDDMAMTPAGYSPASAPAPAPARDPMSVLSGLPSSADLAKSLPSPEAARASFGAITPSPAPAPAPAAAPAAPPSSPSTFGAFSPVAPNEEAMQLPVDKPMPATPLTLNELPPAAPAPAPAAPPAAPAVAPPDDYALPSPQTGPSTPALGLPGASTAVDIQQGLASLPAPVDLPSTPAAAPAAPHPGTQWSGLADMTNAPGFGSLPTVGSDLFSPAPTAQEAIPTVKTPDTPPTQMAGPGVPLGPLSGMPSPMAAPAPSVRSMPAPVAAPAAPPSGPVVSSPQPPSAPSFGGLGALSGLAGTTSTGAAPSAVNGVPPPGVVNYTPGGFGALGPMTPLGYEYAPDISAIAATGLGPFGALFGGGGDFGGFGSLGSTISGGYDAGPGGPNFENYAY